MEAKVTLRVRHDTSQNWTTRNPILSEGEYGFETDTLLLKIGDGTLDWIHLPYLNKLDPSYFTQNEDGTVTFNEEFINDVLTPKTFHKLTFGANGAYEFDGSQDVTVPVYTGGVF